MGVINLTDLRRGANERHPATLPENFVEQAWNITFDRTQLCSRRNGSSYVVNPITGTTVALALHEYTPDSTPSNNRLWAYLNDNTFRYYNPSGWAVTSVTPSPADTFSFSGSVSYASLHGKLFIAANSDQTRLHVWDGTTLRRVGLATPAAPTAANTGAGTLTGARHYRVRYAVLSGATVLLRSEPSAALAFTPSGAGAAVRVTKPATISEGETHWELEESVDGGVNYYRIATTVVGTTTYDDSLATSAVSTSGTLSATAGDYTVPESYRFLVVDRDRLVGFGNHEDASKDSDMCWTVVGSDTSGVGNDERVPTSTGSRLRIDGQNGGRLTGARVYDTQIIAFKRKGVYLISHTRNRSNAYTFDPLSATVGAIEGSVCEGVDEQGRAALYFLDDALGPMRYGARGFEQLAPHLQRTFNSYILLTASTIVANATFQPNRREVHFHFAQTGSNTTTAYPTLAMVYNVETGGVSWTFYNTTTANRLDGFPITACITLSSGLSYIGTTNGSGGGALVQVDVSGATQDFGSVGLKAWIRTKAFAPDPRALHQRFAVNGGILGARPLAGVTVTVTIVRDYDKEFLPYSVSLAPNAATNPSAIDERFVTVPIDEFSLAEATVVQFELGDTVGGGASVASVAQWSIEQFTALTSPNGPNAGVGS